MFNYLPRTVFTEHSCFPSPVAWSLRLGISVLESTVLVLQKMVLLTSVKRTKRTQVIRALSLTERMREYWHYCYTTVDHTRICEHGRGMPYLQLQTNDRSMKTFAEEPSSHIHLRHETIIGLHQLPFYLIRNLLNILIRFS